MGRTTTPTFRVEINDVVLATGNRNVAQMAWDTTRAGRPNDATLAEYVSRYEASTAPGGANDHLGVTVVTTARVIRQSTNEIVAAYTAPAFRRVA